MKDTDTGSKAVPARRARRAAPRGAGGRSRNGTREQPPEDPPGGAEPPGRAEPPDGAEPRRGRRPAAPRRAGPAKASPDRARRGRAGSRRVDPVSKISASALRRVSVLGDRPGQVVQSLAQQSQRRRGGAVLGVLLGLSALSLVALLVVLGVQMLAVSDHQASANTPIVPPPEGHSRLQPDLFHAQPHLDLFDGITERGAEEEPLTEEEVFDGAATLELDGLELELGDSEYTDTCTSVVWGEELAEALAETGCVGAARGAYQDEDGDYVAQFTLFDLADADGAEVVVEQLDPVAGLPGFLLPLNTELTGLNDGYSQAVAQVMGHYLAVVWVARADGAVPEQDDESMAGLTVAAMDAANVVYRRVHQAG